MWDVGWNGMRGARGQEVCLAADDHFQFAAKDKGDLFMRVTMLGQPAAFCDFPDGEGALFAVHHFPKKTRSYLPGRDIGEVFHVRFCVEVTEKRPDAV